MATSSMDSAPPVLSAGVHVITGGSRRLMYMPVLLAGAPAAKVADVMSVSMTMALLPRGGVYATYSGGMR